MGTISEKIIIIRKPRKCFGCLRLMEKGETALTQTATNDGKIYDITICDECREKVSNMGSDEEFFEGDLKEPY